MKDFKCTGGDWKVRKTVDDSGDYEIPTYDIIAVYEYGPTTIGCADSNPFNAKLFASSKDLFYALKDKLMCNGCSGFPDICDGCREKKNKELIESIAATVRCKTIQDIL